MDKFDENGELLKGNRWKNELFLQIISQLHGMNTTIAKMEEGERQIQTNQWKNRGYWKEISDKDEKW